MSPRAIRLFAAGALLQGASLAPLGWLAATGAPGAAVPGAVWLAAGWLGLAGVALQLAGLAGWGLAALLASWGRDCPTMTDRWRTNRWRDNR